MLVLYLTIITADLVLSECLSDGSWSPVSLGCIFDPAAVARNMYRGTPIQWREEEGISLGSIIAITIISSLIIISLLVGFIVISHRKRGAVARAKKLSRLNGVKVLPDIVRKNECMVSIVRGYILAIMSITQEQRQDHLHTHTEDNEDHHQKILSKYSTQNTLYHKTSPLSTNM